ncbi:small, acid-soluble spore protein, alpha/beta type [Romboutsia sp.]|uniref:small, acid-soluble spore protein, alpha/beta type n=1 Tax=Romboutsia sp. TaxID=1965302 RepID=UPI003F3F3622
MNNELLNKPGKKSKANNNNKKKILTDNDIMKYEIASELGLLDKVSEFGWAGLTAKEAGRIGGTLTSRKKQKKKMMEEINKDDGTV